MNELMEQVNKTPIEIALDIDEDGMTPARQLYVLRISSGAVLEMGKIKHC